VIGPTPKRPKGENRPADVIGAAVMMAKIATGEIDESTSSGAWADRPAPSVSVARRADCLPTMVRHREDRW
jgi:hypothetical protein